MPTKLATGISKGEDSSLRFTCGIAEGATFRILDGCNIGWETYGEIRLVPEQFSGFRNTTSVIMLLPNGGE